MKYINEIIYIFTIVSSIIFAFFVYFKNKRSLVNIFFSLYTFSIIGWIVTLFLFYRANQENILIIGRLNFVATEIIAYFGFYFGYYFPKKTFSLSKITNILLFFWLITIISITLWTDLIDRNEIIKSNGIETVFGDFYFLFILHFLIFLSAIFIFPLVKYKKVNNLQKLQIKYLALGTSLSIIIGGITNILLPFVFDYYSLQNIGPIGLFFFFSFTSYAIIKHQLLDIKIVIQKSIIYSGLLAVITSFYIIIVFFLGFLFQQSTDIAILLAAGISTIIGIFGVPPLERYFRKKTDKIFFKDKYDYSQAIFELSEVLNKNLNLETILKKAAEKLKKILKVNKISIILPRDNMIYDEFGKFRRLKEKPSEGLMEAILNDNNSIFIYSQILDLIKQADRNDSLKRKRALKQIEYFGKKYDIEVSVPIRMEKKLIGIIILGKKLSGDMYIQDDYNLLKTFSYQASVAFEKAQLYDQVRKYSEQLEEKVEQRTARIRGLQEDQKRMMQEISHGLQTPLTILKGEIDLLSNEVRDSKKFKSLEKSINRVSKFIYDMLRLANLESHDKKLKINEFNLSKLLIELIEDYEIITGEQGIKIKHKIQPNIIYKGDQGAIEESVSNLVSNSVKYMHESGKKIISLKLEKNKTNIKLEVEDNGIGISAEHISHLFTRFYRANDAAHAKRKGTGLGLAICKEIVEKHKGTIGVSSQAGKGAKFVINLPYKS